MTTIVTATNVKPLAWCQGCGFIGFQEEMTAKSKPWHPAERIFTCSSCLPLESLAAQRVLDNMTALQEADEIRREHISACDWCFRNRSIPFLGGLLAECARRKKAEALR